MRDRLRHLRRDVLEQGAAERHVDELAAAADADHRLAGRHERDVVAVGVADRLAAGSLIDDVTDGRADFSVFRPQKARFGSLELFLRLYFVQKYTLSHFPNRPTNQVVRHC